MGCVQVNPTAPKAKAPPVKPKALSSWNLSPISPISEHMEVDKVPISHLGSQASPVPVVQDLPEAQGHGSLFPTDLPKSKAFYRQLPCTHTSIRAMKTPCFEGRSWRCSLEPPCSVHTRSTEHTQNLGMPQPFACRNFHPQVPKSAGTSLLRRKLPHSSQGLQTRAAKEVQKIIGVSERVN